MKLEIKDNKVDGTYFTAKVFVDGKDITENVTAVEIVKNNIDPFGVKLSLLCETDIEIDNLEEINRKADGQSLVCQYTEQETKQRLQPMKRLLQRLRRQGERGKYESFV